MLLKIQGVVLKTVNFGEADKIVTLLSKEHGKIQAVAKGARRTRSKLIAGTQLFCYGEFLLFKGKTWYYVNQVEMKNSFYKIRNDLERLSCSTYIIQLISEVAQPEQPCKEIFNLSVEALRMFAEGKGNSQLVLRAVELKIMDLSGFRPVVNRCVNCGKPADLYYFSPVSGGVVCNDCKRADLSCYSISPTTIELMKAMLKWNLAKISCIRIEDRLLKELESIMRAYIGIHIDKTFSTIRFMDNIKKIK